MKAFILSIIILGSMSANPQILNISSDSGLYEWSEVYQASDVQDKIESQLRRTNYEILTSSQDLIEAKGLASHMVGGFAPVEINYKVLVQFKEGRYKLTLTAWYLNDGRANTRLEDLKGATKKWLKIINEKLPSIITSINNYDNKDDAW